MEKQFLLQNRLKASGISALLKRVGGIVVGIAAFQFRLPGFDSRPTHLGGVPFLLEPVTSSLSKTACLMILKILR